MHPRPAVRDVADAGVGEYEAPRVTMVLSRAVAGPALADVQVGDGRARQQRRAIARRQRGAVPFEQRLRRLPGVVPLRAVEADGGQPLQRRPVAAVPAVRTRIQGERAIVLTRGLRGGADGEEPFGRVRDGGAARRQAIERVGGRLPVSSGELEARAQIEQRGPSGRSVAAASSGSRRAPDRQLVALHARQLDQQRPLRVGLVARPTSLSSSLATSDQSPSRAASPPSAATGSASVGSSDIARR